METIVIGTLHESKHTYESNATDKDGKAVKLTIHANHRVAAAKLALHKGYHTRDMNMVG